MGVSGQLYDVVVTTQRLCGLEDGMEQDDEARDTRTPTGN